MYLSVKSFKRLSLSFLILINVSFSFSQSFNNNPDLGFINHNAPKSPESSSFEKYGSIPVGEYTGVPIINIPIYELKGFNTSVPIELKYHSSGIKVNQEATWVGLGWDMIPGGRITLEVKGGNDKLTKQYLTQQIDKNILNYIFSIGDLGNSFTAPNTFSNKVFGANNDILLQTTLGGENSCWPTQYGANLPTDQGFNRVTDFFPFIDKAVDFGIGEPDLYHVDVLGKNFSFYKDLLTEKIIIKGESNLFRVNEYLDSYGNITSWTITDDNGIIYFFEQREDTFYSSYLTGLYPSTTMSWLLTKILMVNGEEINYTYSNFGEEILAPTISESEGRIIGETLTLGINDFRENSNINNVNDIQYIKPQYLTKIESKNLLIDFFLSTRNDIGGLGARKLDGIFIKNKFNNELIKSIKLNYSYSNSGVLNDFYFNIDLLDFQSPTSTSVQERMKSRLILNSIDINEINSTKEKSYSFIYNETLLPNKVSIAQDHWGYYNGKNFIHNGSNSNVTFTPSIQSLIDEGIISNSQIGLFVSTIGNPPYFSNYNIQNQGLGHANRMADNQLAQAQILTSIIYPTGGKTSFEYELHKSYYKTSEITGGGLRIKKISNFTATNQLSEVIDYSYENAPNISSGIYMGSLDYLEVKNYVDEYCMPNVSGAPKYPYSSSVTLYSSGNLSSGGPLIGYSKVKTTKFNYLDPNKNEGYTIKYYNANEPIRDLLIVNNVSGNTNFAGINSSFNRIPPLAKNELDGAFLKEEIYNNDNLKVKSRENYYTQHNLIDTIYSLKIVDNRLTEPTFYFRMPVYYFEAMRSYRTTLDSVINNEFFDNKYFETRTSTEYNNFFQPQKITSLSSEKGLNVQHVYFPLSYSNMPDIPGLSEVQGDALAVQILKTKNILNLPVENILVKVNNDNSKVITDGAYFKYDERGNVVENYRLETDISIPENLFQKSSYNGAASGYDFVKDNRYKLNQKATYYLPENLLQEINEDGLKTSYIYDKLNNNLVASVKNAKHSDIAFTSFENNDHGNWNVNGGTQNNIDYLTGSKSFNLVSGSSISKIISTSGEYIISYWTKSGSVNVNGTNPNISSNIQGWIYSEHILNLSSGTPVQITGTALIDELRLYPKESQMSTFTYKLNVGITSVTDPSGRTTYYEYDSFQRLRYVRDQDKNILKVYCYNYAGQSIDCFAEVAPSTPPTIYVRLVVENIYPPSYYYPDPFDLGTMTEEQYANIYFRFYSDAGGTNELTLTESIDININELFNYNYYSSGSGQNQFNYLVTVPSGVNSYNIGPRTVWYNSTYMDPNYWMYVNDSYDYSFELLPHPTETKYVPIN